MIRTPFVIALVCCLVPVHAGWQDWLQQADQLVKQPAVQSLGGSAVGSLSETEIANGLREALTVGAKRAISLLGQRDGFLGNPAVRIPPPQGLSMVGDTLRRFGQDRLVDDFETSINRAAEQAVPATVEIFSDTVSRMTLDDARQILNGPPDAATRYLQRQSSDQLRAAILPLVTDATERTGVTNAYKRLLAGAGPAGQWVDLSSLDLDRHVTEGALDGLFLMLAAEEKRIREDPLARSTELLRKVFSR